MDIETEENPDVLLDVVLEQSGAELLFQKLILLFESERTPDLVELFNKVSQSWEVLKSLLLEMEDFFEFNSVRQGRTHEEIHSHH